MTETGAEKKMFSFYYFIDSLEKEGRQVDVLFCVAVYSDDLIRVLFPYFVVFLE